MSDRRSSDGRERIERRRFSILGLAKIGGAALMALGLWICLGDAVRPGGHPLLGLPIWSAGLFGAMVLPRTLARRWRSRE